jgi:WD40 repeat protein
MVALALALGSWSARPVSAQSMSVFGQNKIAYDNFHWKVYKSPHFDIYFYPESEPFLDEIVSDAESAYVRLSKELDHELRFRIPMVIYKTHGEFEETNIVLEELPEAVGAFAEYVQNRMVLPIDQPPDKLYKLMSHELTHIFQYSLFFEGYLGRALRARIPIWLVEGMASYFGQDEESLDRMVIRDAVVNNFIPPLQAFDQLSYLSYRFGHAVFDFIEQDYGKEGVHNFIYEYRKVLLTGNVEKAIKEAFGIDMDTFNRNFQRYLRKKYFPVLLEKKSPDDYGKEIGIQQQGVFTFSPTLSPSGELVATLANPKMDLDLIVLSAEDGKTVKNLTKGWSNKYRYLVTEAFQGRRDLSWSPAGDQIAVLVRKENTRKLAIYDSLHGKLERIITLPGIAQAASPTFSPDGKRIAFEGNKNGVVDIFEIDLATKAIRNLTQDDDFDGNPWYAGDGLTLLYDRRIGESWKIFSVDVSDATQKTQLTFGPSVDLQPSYSRDGKTVFFSSDRGGYGVFNIFALDLASGATRQYTDVVGGCFSPVEMAPREGEPYLVMTAYFDGTFRLYRMPLRQSEAVATAETAIPGAPEAVPFEPPLNLKADLATIKPYKLKWDLEAPSISIGVTDDGTFLSNVILQFADLLGDHRIGVQYYSVADFSNFVATYTNLKHRNRWGVTVFDLRDYYLSSGGFNNSSRQSQRNSGVQFLAQFPINRYYRIDAAVTASDSSQDLFTGYSTDANGFIVSNFTTVNDRFLTFQPSLVGDTTRFQSFGPFQGKRFELGVTYGLNLGGELPGNVVQYHLDFRAYKQLTRRSVLAFQAAGIVNKGGRDIFYGVGGLNTLRGYNFRDFYGSNVAGASLELRFPFVDELRFPFGPLRNIRGVVFLDAGTAWLPGDEFFDPDLQFVRAQPNPDGTFTNIPFSWWDDTNNRMQDLRATYGVGFQLFFIGGLQFNWDWSKRLPYTRYVDNPLTPGVVDLVPVESSIDGWRSEFFIAYDW